MFRAVLPRAAPRASLRACGPNAVPASFIAPPTFIGISKRGYASESGKYLILQHLLPQWRSFLFFPDWIADRGFADQQVTMIWLSSVVVSPATLPPSRLVRRVSRYELISPFKQLRRRARSWPTREFGLTEHLDRPPVSRSAEPSVVPA